MRHSNAKSIRTRKTLVAGALVSALVAAPAGAAEARCKPVLDALMSVFRTPTHLVTTESGGGRGGEPRVNETIYTAQAIYVKSRRGWVKSPISPQEMAEQQKKNQAEAKSVTCRALRDETVDGEPAAVYSSHSESDGTTSDAVVWISKKSGLLLKEELDLDVGDVGGKTHHSTRFDYRDVRPPEGVD